MHKLPSLAETPAGTYHCKNRRHASQGGLGGLCGGMLIKFTWRKTRRFYFQHTAPRLSFRGALLQPPASRTGSETKKHRSPDGPSDRDTRPAAPGPQPGTAPYCRFGFPVPGRGVPPVSLPPRRPARRGLPGRRGARPRPRGNRARPGLAAAAGGRQARPGPAPLLTGPAQPPGARRHRHPRGPAPARRQP